MSMNDPNRKLGNLVGYPIILELQLRSAVKIGFVLPEVLELRIQSKVRPLAGFSSFKAAGCVDPSIATLGN